MMKKKMKEGLSKEEVLEIEIVEIVQFQEKRLLPLSKSTQ